MNNLKYRMYFFVPYNISDIQKGIQAGHCALNYASLFGRTKLFKEFVENHQTWIILNGGTTNNMQQGTMNVIEQSLYDNSINHAAFHEPDLNLALTAVCFLADERVWNFTDYPDFYPERDEGKYYIFHKRMGGDTNIFLRNLIRDKRLA